MNNLEFLITLVIITVAQSFIFYAYARETRTELLRVIDQLLEILQEPLTDQLEETLKIIDVNRLGDKEYKH